MHHACLKNRYSKAVKETLWGNKVSFCLCIALLFMSGMDSLNMSDFEQLNTDMVRCYNSEHMPVFHHNNLFAHLSKLSIQLGIGYISSLEHSKTGID